MKSFRQQLAEQDIKAVAVFVYEVFIKSKAKNTRYHTEANGWFNHEQYKVAFPFVLGEIPLDTPWEDLTEQQKKGKQLFMNSCISCHDRAKVKEQGEPWQSRPLSFPRNEYTNKQVDAVSEATPMGVHDSRVDENGLNLNSIERKGEQLFKDNCVFCHSNDGTGKNWIGSFIEPHPRDLSDVAFLKQHSVESLAQKIALGVPGSAMPAWKTVLTKEEISAISAYIFKRFMRE